MSFIKITPLILTNRWSFSHRLREGHDISISHEKIATSQHFYDNLPPPVEESPPCFLSRAATADKTNALFKHETPAGVLLWRKQKQYFIQH